MEKTEKRDLTKGKVWQKLFAFALPILIINLLQAVYNVVDMVIVGRFVGPAGMSAVSIGGQVTVVVFSIVNGFANAGAVVVGQLYGAGKKEEISKFTGTLLTFLVALAALCTAGFIVFHAPLLRALNTPAESYAQTVSYLVICLCGTVFVFVYNGFYGLFRGLGESQRPMRIILITTVENIVLDLLFVGVFGMGAAGAAYATILSQCTSMCLIAYMAKKHLQLFELRLSFFRIEWKKLLTLIKIGLPQVSQFVLTSLSFMLVGGLVNAYGVNASAAVGAVNKIWNFTVLPGQAMMAALLSLTAQNLPQKQYRRIIQGLLWGAGMVSAVALAVMLLCEFAPGFVLGLFTGDLGVIQAGLTYLQIFATCFIIENCMFCLFGVLTGAGYTTVTMSCAIITAFGVRYLFAYVLSRFTGLGLNGVALACCLAPVVSAAVCILFLASGKWKQSRVRV